MSEPKAAIASVRYPVLKGNFNPAISARGAIVMDADSKVVLYAKNPDLRFTLASTTKIMTAITALDYFSLKDEMIVKNSRFEGSVVGFKLGEKVTFENLLYGMLLPSGNDAALTIAVNFPGGEKEFVNLMNQNAQKWQLENTHFEDTSGLNDGNYTTPLDLARLSAIAIQNPEFAKIVSTKDKIITDASGKNVYQLNNLNKLLGFNGVNGIKTGYTEEAGQVLVTSESFVQDGNSHTVVIVVMGSEDRFFDTQIILNELSGNINYLTIRP
ncbi:hypothetical protein M1307_00255 [Patescibacteria group bacterium]|nr:hypothetical protein [Patescibacteria group bacterium]